ncbi:chloride channel [Glomus cerebriforme]|uniref:Chloride channel protein n=1 Tax=Glomus cerebriforme TaxID=658196 RepID=A0A397S4E8_9GLOM|nr:chloride channel [Glomus cerebriforme]
MADRSKIGSINDQINNEDIDSIVQSPWSSSIASGHSKDSIKEHEPDETTSLLEGAREPSVRYSHFPSVREDDIAVNSTPRFRRHTWNPRQLKQLTAALTEQIGRYKRRSGAYDEDKQAMVSEGGGIRVWYDDYTTIDWIHDYVKERVRVRKLHSIKGIRGWIITSYDGLQGWFLVFLIGIVTACFAAGVDIAAEWGSDLKDGYCTTSLRSNKNFCCANSTHDKECEEWKSWSQAMQINDSRDLFDCLAYVVVAFLFATGSVLLVKHNSLYPSPSSKSSAQQENTSLHRKQLKLYAAGSGIPEVKTILSGFVIRGFLGIRTLWVKAFSLAMVVSAGMTLGKEGPFVHIACCIGNILSRLFHKYNKNEGKRREILSASAAAGVSVAFAAPIGGVLFSLEEVSYYFPSKTLCRSFFCAIVAAVSLKLINPFGTGKIVMFQVFYNKDWHVFEIVNFLILGVIGGLIGALLCKSIFLYTKYIRNRTWLKQWPVVEVMIVVTITAAVNFWNKYTRMSNTDLVFGLFSECTVENEHDGLCVNSPEGMYEIFNLLGLALISKFLTCVITFGIRTPAGIFIPTLLIGACFGRMLGIAMQYLTMTYPNFPIFSTVCNQNEDRNCVIPGVYAIVGAAASLAGVTRMTVSLTVIMFELTGALTYVLPIMTAIMISKWVSDGIVKHGIYDLLIDLGGHPYLDSKAEYDEATSTLTTTLELCQKDLEVIDVNDLNTIGELKAKLKKLATSGYSDAGFPIVDNTILVGYIASTELEHALSLVHSSDNSTRCYFKELIFENVIDKSTNFTAYVNQAPLTVSKNASLEVVLELFKKLGLRYVIVVDRGQYIGVIHKKRLLVYLRQIKGENN